jgi:predicted RNA-binding Zn ribbon-like protein
MHVASVAESEHRITLETLVELHNALTDDDGVDVRGILTHAGFSRAPDASAASIERVARRITDLSSFLTELPDSDADTAAAQITEQLTELPITPSIVDHGGVGPHIHWTPTTARFDDQVMADVMMALAQEVCDNGTIRFGTCAARDCDHLFYDSTRNRSKKFCADPRCASRTHTADHRRRRSTKAT